MIRLSLILIVAPAQAQVYSEGTVILQQAHEAACASGCVRVHADAASLAGAVLVANVQAAPLTANGRPVRWQPFVLCAESDLPQSTCALRTEESSRAHTWLVGGFATQPVPGAGLTTVRLTIASETETHEVRIPAQYDFRGLQPSCTLTSSGNLRFGKARAQVAGTIRLDPVRARRSYSGDQSDAAGGTTFTFGHVTILSTVKAVTVTVTAPGALVGASGRVPFTSELAYQAGPDSGYRLIVAGSGSQTVTTRAGSRSYFRLGGTVITSDTDASGPFTGSAILRFSC